MNSNLYFIIVNLLLFSFCFCEISETQKEKLLNDFISYYNNLRSRVYTSQEGFLRNTQQVNDTTYQIVVDLRVTEISNVAVIKVLQCTATVQYSETGVSVSSDSCKELGDRSPTETSQAQAPLSQVEVTEPSIVKKPVQLDNEVQDSAITSGEQFIAVPRDQPSAPCVGCTSHVNPQAAGVNDLANLGVKQLNIHEPHVKHTLDTVLDVERQVQVVNGVRYVLTFSVKFNECFEQESLDCVTSRICKVTILVKPWVKLPNGGNYKAILANNCTEEWQYGDNGEVITDLPTTRDGGDTNGSDDDLQAKYNTNVDAQPNQERLLTDEEIKNIQDQIIPNSRFHKVTEPDQVPITSTDASGVSKQHVFKVDSGKHSKNSIPVSVTTNTDPQFINIIEDKKKAIDDLLSYFDFSGLKPKTENDEAIPRVRRSYDYDLQVLSLAEDYHGIKKSIENARFMYTMAQAMVDYLNEMDMEIKNRAVKDVVRAEEEIDNLQRFVYIQARVIIPCDKVECEPRDEVIQICNGVIDGTNENSPQILNTFCYNDYKERDYRDVIKEISFDDPVLQKLTKEAIEKIESESTSKYAMKLNRIISANTQVTSGTLTKFSIVVDYIKCNKSVPLLLRVNCTVIEHLGSKICEVIVHERHWLKERKISYSCTDRPVDMKISKSKSLIKNITVDDPKVNEMLLEAVQYLETQSNKNSKLKIVNIKSISSQIVAGFLIKIEFVVGYTNCTEENYSRDEISKCELMINEGLRLCKAQIWDRSWIIDGRQVEVSCDDIAKINEIEKMRKKRSIDYTGGQVQQSVNDSNLEYIAFAKESLKKFLQSTSSIQHYKVVKVHKATIQEVAGKLIRIEFSISPTNCQIKTDGLLSSSNCYIVNSKNLFRCRSKILQNVWLDKKQYFVNCNTKEQEQQIKTHSNELKEHDPSDLKYRQLAEESLKKYFHDTGNSLYHRVVQVQRVTTQIVSGLLTCIDFIISTNNKTDSDHDTVRCRSKVLEKHWLGTKDINVTCQMQENKKIFDDPKPDNPQFMQIAVESLQKFIKINPDSHLLRVTFVDEVIQSGNVAKIQFLASHTEDDDGDTLCHAEYTEQGRSDIKVNCHLIGTVLRKNEVTEDDPKYYKYVHLADESLHKYIQSINSSHLYTIVNIENITVQWKDGINTVINFIASPINSENSELHGKRCVSQIREQPWLNNKHIDINCELYKDLYRAKRQIYGGEIEQDPTDSAYKKLTEESLQKYVQESGITQPLVVVRVDRVTTQVVSGSLTRIDFVVSGGQYSTTLKCNSEIWEQPWLNKKDIKVSCQNDDKRTKRSVLGGLEEQDPTDSAYKTLAEESLQKYKQESGTTQSLVVERVERVTTQVVSGTITRIDFVVSDGQYSTTLKCNSEIWEQPWLNKKDIKVNCQNDDKKTKRSVLGGLEEQDPTDSAYKKLAEESLQKYVEESGTTQSLVVERVERVTTQVVSGTITRIDFVVSDRQFSTPLKCNSEIWEQPWLNKKDIKVSCQKDNQETKRSNMPGGLLEQDPTKLEYQKLAQESLLKYTKESGTTQHLEIVRVDKVTTQVVSGVVTRIDFLVFSKQDSTISTCHSEVWEQPWLNKKDITVSCQNDVKNTKRSLPGGLEEQDPTDSAYKTLAEESLQKYKQESGTTQSLVVERVERVTTQVVSGTITRIDFVVSGGQYPTTLKCNSEIWEQPWLNKKDIKVSCQNDVKNTKRSLPGGLEEQDPTDSAYKMLAEESLQKYKQESGTTQPLVVVRVDRVTTQVVSGTITRIDFVVSDRQFSTTLKCNSEIWEQPWLNKKDIKVSCQNDDKRTKRSVLGGLEEQDPTDSAYKKLAEESLQKYKQESGTTQSLVVERVERVTTQVVSGTITRIDFVVSDQQFSTPLKCNSEIWEQPWLNKKDIKVSCQNDDKKTKRSVLGGQDEKDPTDPTYRKLAEESLQKYVEESGTTQPLVVVRVVRVTTQVVSGTITRIDFVVSDQQFSTPLKCNSEIWEQPWLNKKDIKVSCQNDDKKTKRSVLGGQDEKDPTDPTYKKLAEESLQKYVEESGTTQSLVVERVERVTTQVVSGTITRIDFVVSGGQYSTTLKCNSEIWEQPWLNKKDIKVSCQNDDKKTKRSVLGGQDEKDPTDPTYRKLAEESLQKYVEESGTTQPLVVVRVDRVTTQVVSGTITRIDFVVSDQQFSTPLKCNSEIWEQPWLNKKDIKVSCQNDDKKTKRSVLGGQDEKDPTDPTYKKLAEESLQKYVEESGTTHSLVVERVERVTTQVVSGTITRIDFVVSDRQFSTPLKCNSEIWEQPWLNKKDIKVSCQKDNQGTKRSNMPGGLLEQDPTKLEYQKLAQESLLKYTKESGTTQHLEIVRVDKVTTQVVSGVVTRIDFLVFSKQDSTISICHSEVWEQPWLNKKDITVSCQNDVKNTKRSLPGGLEEQDPTDSAYKTLAEESLQKYKQESGTTQSLVVERVERVTTQVVSGTITRIDFVVSGGQYSTTLKCNSEIWEQPWLNKKDIKVSCQKDNQETKRSNMPGGLLEQDPTKLEYQKLAQESLLKYTKESGTTQHLEIVRVDKVTTQVVSGVVTRIDFLVFSKQDSTISTCHSEVWEQPWLNKKDITVSCQNDVKNTKRSLPGGLEEQDPTDSAYKTLAEESLQKYKQESGTTQSLVVERVERVTTQVVSGTVTRIDFVVSGGQYPTTLKCNSEIWEQPWLNKKDIKVSCQNDVKNTKRSLPGGLEEQDPTDSAYKMLAEESLRKYKQESGTTQPLVVVRVDRVTTQVVSGTITRIDFVVSDRQFSTTLKCNSEIWEQPWLNKKDIKVSCQNDDKRTKRSVLGGLEEQDPTDSAYKKLAEESLQKYKQESGTTQSLVVERVERVTTQVVSGTITRIDFVVSDQQFSTPLKCNSEIWEQPWLNKKDIKVSCQNDDKKTKRSVLGGQDEKDPTDPTYRKLAEESLQKYVEESGTTQSLVVERVERVTTQVVSGTITRIDFVVSGGQYPTTKCNSEIWEQPWLNKKDIKVSCQNDVKNTKRSLPGGLKEQDPTDSAYKMLAEESLQKYKQESGTTQPLVVVRVDRVTTQVVSGTITRIDFVVSDQQFSTPLKCNSEIWEQPWLNKKDIKVSCQNDDKKTKRSVLGGQDEKDPTDPTYKKLAEESLQKYVEESGTTQSLVVERVERVTTQVVSGTITRIDFVVSDRQFSTPLKCNSEIWEQPWLNKKDIKVSCQKDNQETKRSNMPGGLLEQDPTKLEYQKLAQESLLKYTKESGTTQHLEIVRVDKVTTQVVSGVVTRIDFLVFSKQDSTISTCHSEVWEQPWLNKKDITVSCQDDNKNTKRSLPGGLEEQDPTDSAYKTLAEESMQKYKQESGTTQSLVVERVERVTTQVVSGTITRIDFVVSDQQFSTTLKCNSEIWEQPWLNKKDIKVNCQNDDKRTKRSVLGGLEEQDPTDSAYKKLAEESLQKYKQESGTTQSLVVERVERVTTQVVSGTITRIDFVVSDRQFSTTLKCKSEIWEQPWLNKKDIIVNCQNDDKRTKRSVLGGLEEQDPTDSAYKKLAEESLQKYKQESGTTQSLVVERVERVTTQVVSGMITRIDFVVSDRQFSTPLKCNSEIWEQPWLNKKDIKVSCQKDNQETKRSNMPGGLLEQDPTKLEYQKLAQESLLKYTKESGTTQHLEIVRVDKVTTQVVSGVVTRIDFLVFSKQDSTKSTCHSEVWEQPWLNKKDITVSCQNDNKNTKRSLPGGLEEQDPTDSAYKTLAEESMQKYKQESGTTQSLVVERVERVTTQVVSGTITRIDFVVSDRQLSTTLKCNSEIWEQPWLNKKDIKVNCQNDDKRTKRSVLGGLEEQDPTDSAYKKLAEESLQKYKQESGTTQSLVVERVERVTTQVVSGTITRIDFVVSDGQYPTTKCNSEIWEQPWLNKKDIKVSCQNDVKNTKRSLPGGLKEQDPTDSAYKMLAEESLQKYKQESGTTQPLVVVRVDRVTTQVVSGTITRIDFVVSDQQFSTPLKCNSEIWEQPWLNKKDIKVSCQNDDKKTKRSVLGGQDEKDPTDPTYKKLAEESLQKYVEESGTTQSLVVERVERVTTQVVSGMITRIDFVVSDRQFSTPLKCNSEIWEQPWLNKKDITVSCQDDDKKTKRSLPGGLEEQDPTDSAYKMLAEESLQKYVQESGTTQPLLVVRVDRVTTQVVSGTITRIDFVVSDRQFSTPLKCNSEIWEQPWLNKKDIKVSCQNDDKRTKGSVPGGQNEKDPTDPAYKKLAEESLQKYVQESGTTQPLVVVKVNRVTTQIVSGTVTRIEFVVFGGQYSRTSKCYSEIWEEPWLNKKDIKVSCQNDNQGAKRYDMVGGLVVQDPTKLKYKKLAQESLLKYTKESGITQPLEIVRVDKVTTELISGLITRIDFVVVSKQNSKMSTCHSDVLEQPWLNKKSIKVSCQNDNIIKRDNGTPGGLTQRDPNNPAYRKLAEESLQKFLINSGNRYPYRVISIINVASQVVAGLKTFIEFTVAHTDNPSTVIYCHSSIWEQEWINKKEIDVNCDNYNQSTRNKRELIPSTADKTHTLRANNSQLLINEEQDPSQPKYKLLAEESLRKYAQKSKIYHKVIEVKRVSTRVVAGFKYEIDFSAAPTECSINVTSVIVQNCKKLDNVILYCHSDIWDRPWLKQKKIDVQCYGPDENDFEDYGSDDSVDTTVISPDQKNNDKKYKLLAQEASEKYLTTSNRRFVHKVTEIHSVSENIADGTITKIEYSLSPTTCLRNETNSFNDTCKIKKPIVVFRCNANIWDRPWLHLEKDITVTCKKNSDNKNTKHKRDLGVRKVRQIGDDDDEMDEDTVYYYADRAVQHVNDQSQSNNLHKLITIHAVQHSIQMDTVTIKMYIEIAETFCLRHHRDKNLHDCEEMDGLNHRLCFVRLWPSPDDELIVRHVSVVCDDDQDFQSVSGVNIPELLRMSIVDLERSPDIAYKLVHQGEPQIIPSLDSRIPFKLNFIIATTNCSKDVNLRDNPFQCYVNTAIPSKSCHSFIWLKAETKFIRYINAKCTPIQRSRRALSDPTNIALDNLEIQKLVSASLEKLEMSSLQRYKQRVLQINSHSTKITSGKVTTIDFDVGYTSCLKYEWVENITSCDFLEHLPRRRCVAQIWQRLWIENGKNIDVNCVDDETPLESHIEFESAEMANELAREALKHIEAKYPHPSKQKVVRIFSLEKQVIAGIHYRMKIEVGLTDCVALSEQTDCKLQKNQVLNKFCRVNVWVRPWTDHPPNFRVSCDFQEGTSHDFYHQVQSEHLFYNFLTTYSPSYQNDYSEMHKRFEIFKTNIKKIHELNVHEKGTATYGVTRFADLTYEEFSSTYMGLKTKLRDANQIPMKKSDIPDIKIPQNFDWREYDAVTEVKDQGSCGSCWAFSVTGNIEGQWKMQSGQLVSLSEQELVDCDKLDQGCNGGLPDNAYRAIEQMGGLELESDYPYEAVDEKCEFNKTLAKVQISGAVNITTNETGMAQWLVHNGPISIGINANAMQFYMGGISHPWKVLCNPGNLDHGVLIVGYGVKDYPLFHKQLPYWIVKNSWGKSWGEQGYYRVYRGDGTCGLNQMASSAII